jgi:hypothetical protein
MGFDPSTRGGEGRPPGVGVGGEDDEEEGLSSADRMDMNNGDGGMNVDGEPVRAPSANAEMEQKLIELSTRPDIYELLSRSMAPSIWEMDDVKKGILLQLFGGTNKNISRGGGGGGPRFRGDINILMVGDPGTSKSQILSVSRGVRHGRDHHGDANLKHLIQWPVRAQDRTSWGVHIRQRFVSRRSDCLYHPGPRLQAVGA